MEEKIKEIANYYGSVQLVKLLEEVTELQTSLLNVVANCSDEKSVMFKNFATVSECLAKEVKQYCKTCITKNIDFNHILEHKIEYDVYSNLFEEVADVTIMINQFKYLFDKPFYDFLDRQINYKVERQMKRIKKEKEVFKNDSRTRTLHQKIPQQNI